MQKLNKMVLFVRRQPRWRLVVAVLALAGAGVLWFTSSGKSAGQALTFAARRGPLEISVLEGGSLQALESQEIKCEVRVGYQGTKILKIVEEGYLVTEEDVKNGKVLCELDSSDLQKQIVQQEIQYQGAVASLTDAQQNYEIQLGQNESDIKTAEQKTRFMRMDFDKFLGDSVTKEIVAEVGLEALLAAASTNNFEETLNAEQASGGKPKPETRPAASTAPTTASAGSDAPVFVIQPVVNTDVPSATPVATPPLATAKSEAGADDSKATTPEPLAAVLIDFSKYASIELLGDGEAKQKLRKFEDDLQVAQKELGQAKATLEGTQRLFEKGFVTRTDLQRDEIAHENTRLKVQTASTAQSLFLKYEFLKSAEESLSKYAEAVRELDKARRVAISKLAQTKARLNSAKGQYEVAVRQRKDMNEQLEKGTLRARKTGLVVYGSGRDDMMYYGDQEPIREGATVRERQAIITIPDMTRMSVKVKIHESYIKKVKKGLKARITVDAFPDESLKGEVTKVGVLPDSQNRWMSPDLKVYLTTITIDGTHDWVKPGMSAKVEILVNHLDDVVHIPLQAVSNEGGKQVCYLPHGFKPERREIVIGEFTDEFVEVKSGLKEGERVLLRPPDDTETEGLDKKQKSPDKEQEKPAAPAAPATSAKAS